MGIKNRVLSKSLSFLYFLIALSWDLALIPALITFFGLFIILFVKDKKKASRNFSSPFKFLLKTGPIKILTPSAYSSSTFLIVSKLLPLVSLGKIFILSLLI